MNPLPIPAAITTAWLDLDTAPDNLGAVLDAEERARAAAYRNPRDGRRFVIRRGWLRHLLAAELGEAPQALRFTTGAFGKPSLPLASDLIFSISHSAGQALAAISRQGPVGCDIEARDPAKADPAIAERYFAPPERAELARLADQTWINGFFNAWTRKEAVVKAIGTGLSMPLQAFSVSLTPGEPARVIAGAPGWRLAALPAPPGFTAALAFT